MEGKRDSNHKATGRGGPNLVLFQDQEAQPGTVNEQEKVYLKVLTVNGVQLWLTGAEGGVVIGFAFSKYHSDF